ncbi:MAG: DUF4339 domain-containing protein [Bacteroidota bacterium]|nr:DUF4339 domain-containing protein [Bacteroidota bacterium]
MKRYYIMVNDKPKGPFTIDKLKRYKLEKDTMAYYIGMPEWSTVEYISELNELLHVQPYIFNQYKKRKQLLVAGLFFLIFFGLAFLVYIIYSNTVIANRTLESSVHLIY